MAIFLVFAVLLMEFRSMIQPFAIVLGAVLALLGAVAALSMTGTSLNIVSFLGAIIGVGIVAKNGILMLDFVEQLQARGYSVFDSLVQSGRRRLRPVLMTSLATFIGLLPLAYGVGGRGRICFAPGHCHRRRLIRLPAIVSDRHPGVLLRDDAVARTQVGQACRPVK